MKRSAQPALSYEGQRALDQYAHALQQVEHLTAVTIRNYPSDLRQFIAWCEAGWCVEQDEQPFTPKAVAPPLLICYRTYLQTTLRLKPSTVNRTLMLHTGLRARELCTPTRQQVHVGKRNGMLRVIGKRNKVREVSLNATARSILCMYLEALPKERIYLFHSGKTQEALTERALGHLITTYARQAHLVDVSPRALRHRFGYRMAEVVPLHWLAQIMGMTRSTT